MPTGTAKTRDYSLDILRIIACVMVIGIHTVIEGWYDTSPRTFSWIVLNFYDSVFRPAVPLFIMISGALFLRKDSIDIKKIWTRNIPRLAVLYFLFVIFYAVMNRGLHEAIADPNAVWAEVFGANPQYHLWYLRTMINLYAVAPLLWLLVRAMDRKTIRYFLGLFFIFSLVCQTVYDLPFLPAWLHDQINLFVEMDLVRYSAYFMLGYFLTDPETEKRFSGKQLAIGYCIALVLGAGINQWIAWVNNWPTQAMYGNFALPVAVESVCLFLLVRKRFGGAAFSMSFSKWLVRLSDSTLFVYLIHPFVIRRLQIYFHLYIMKYNVLFSAPLMILLVFVLSSTAGMLLKQIPGLKKLL